MSTTIGRRAHAGRMIMRLRGRMEAVVSVQCPYCGEWQSILLDPESVGEMVQDCEVCCEPWHMIVRRGLDGKLAVSLGRT
jgi:cysteine-rich CPXCG protein